MHIKIFIMILISLFCMCLGVEKALFIKNNIIYFNDGSNLEIQPFIKYPQVQTIGLSLPLNTIEEFLIIPEWTRVIVVKRFNYYESIELQISLYNYNGYLVFPSIIESNVNFHIYRKSNTIILENFDTGHEEENEKVFRSWMFDKNLKLIKIIQHYSVSKFGNSEDEKVVWFYSKIKGRKILIIEAVDGKFSKEISAVTTKQIKVEYEGKIYVINIPD